MVCVTTNAVSGQSYWFLESMIMEVLILLREKRNVGALVRLVRSEVQTCRYFVF